MDARGRAGVAPRSHRLSRSQIAWSCHMGGMSSAEQRSDTELLLAARTSPEPFGVFYERHMTSVLAFFRRGCQARRRHLT
jgi:hypothetical protein